MITIKDFLTTSDQKIKSDFIQQSAIEEFLPEIFKVKNKNCAYALSVLSKKTSLIFKYGVEFETCMQDFCKSDDPKIRKYGYVIAGNISSPLCEKILKNAIEQEQTFYTLPSLMLALGKFKPLATTLMQRVENQKTELAEKIYNEILQNYQKVNPPKVYECQELNFQTQDCLVTTQKCYEDLLCKSLQTKKQKIKSGIVCKNLSYDNYLELCSRRDIYEVLICVGSFSLDIAITEGLNKLSGLVGDVTVGYRICCNDKQFVEKLVSQAQKLNYTNLINSPSNYSFTISVTFDNTTNQASVYIKWEKLKADFSYRTEFLPASINPTTASIIANIANYYNANAKTSYDPFCGTATMLIERFNANPSIEIFGSDISQEAIEKARVNLSNAKINCKLNVLDVAKVKKPCDEIISNLPYGLRVGTHSANEKIYNSLIKVCSQNLSYGGYAFLYTADKKLLRDLIKKSSLTFIEELNFISGGLYCSLFIVKKEF